MIKYAQVVNNMKNPKIYRNNCKEDILSKLAFQKDHAEYKVGKTLSATIDVGKKRDNQEDAVIIAEHPKNQNFKLIGVSDGVGGQSQGELASNHVAKKLILWFEGLDTSCFEDIEKLKDEFRAMVYHIMDDSEALYGAATLAVAIVGKEETLIINIGDSRIYTYRKGRLKQQTKDDSEVQELYDEEAIPFKEIMRFHERSNVIYEAIEPGSRRYKPTFTVIKNSDYDRLYAFTDGVTDCLSTEELENIIKKSRKEATKEIVKKALENDSYLWDSIYNLNEEDFKIALELKEILYSDYINVIEGGKDNATAAEYRKK